MRNDAEIEVDVLENARQPARLTQEGIIVQKDDRHVPGLQTAEEIREMRGANLDDWISRDLLTLPDAQDIVGLVTEKNAERVYSRLQPNVQRMPI